MTILDSFLEFIVGDFDNSQQYDELNKKGINFPYAKHKNSLCNYKIKNLPNNFSKQFMIEESYYTINDNVKPSHHLFLFEEMDNKIKLTSYEIPKPYNKNNFTYDNVSELNFEDFESSKKFKPAIYEFNEGVWQGGSISNFSETLTFTLFEKFSKQQLEVVEKMEVNGKKTFGYDEPIIYKRIK